jgi:hypothetical protein
MDQNLIANILSITLFLVSLFVALRSFALYVQVRSSRLCILGVSMTVIALTAAAGFAGDNVTSVTLNVDWFNYIGQTVSFLFILLGLVRSSEHYLRTVLRYQLLATVPLVILMLLAPVLPPDFPNPVVTKTLLSGSRGVICLFIFFYYTSAFMTKETRFSFLMSGAFLLLSFGYFTIMPKYALPSDLLDHTGDIMRVSGLAAMLAAVVGG